MLNVANGNAVSRRTFAPGVQARPQGYNNASSCYFSKVQVEFLFWCTRDMTVKITHVPMMEQGSMSRKTRCGGCQPLDRVLRPLVLVVLSSESRDHHSSRIAPEILHFIAKGEWAYAFSSTRGLRYSTFDIGTRSYKPVYYLKLVLS